MTFTIRHRGDASRHILCDFWCDDHGKFSALVASDASDFAPCPHPLTSAFLPDDPATAKWQPCNVLSPWCPSPIRFKIGICATRGNHQKAEHKGWLDTQNLEDGQDFADWQDDREAVHEEMRKEQVMELVKSDR